MPRQMPTTPGPRILRSSPRRKPPPRVPNRRPRFPTSTPPPGPSAHPSGFSIRSQQGSISFNPAAFKAPVRTSVATEFNSREQAYSTINPRSPSIGKFVPAANPPRADEVFVNSRALRPTWRQALFQRRFSSSLLRLVRSV